MPFRYVVPLAAVFVALVVGLARSPLPADASFHCMRIHAVMGGANGNANIQHVELRMTIAGQTSLALGHTKLVFFDAAGSQTGTYTFLTDPPNGAVAGTSILIGTSDFALNSTVAPDYTMPINVMAPSGKVQFVGDTNCSFSGTIIDSVAYGSYTGTVDCPPLPAAPAPAAALPVTGAQALTLNNLNSTCSNNAAEYSLMTAAPRNNAGQTGSICTPGPCPTPAPTPTPSPTPVPTPTPTPGPGTDTDGDGVPDVSDNCPNWPNPAPAQALPPWTVPPGDPDCDGFPSTVKATGRGSESYITTLANTACAANLTPNNESPDAWPVDNNDDKKAGLADILAYIPWYLANVPPGPARLDLNEDGKIGLADILTFIPFYLTTCTP